MNENEALAALQQCRPLMITLAEQGYNYLYDPADLALVKQYQESIEATASFFELAQAEVERQFPLKGYLWLMFYHETAQDVEALAAESSDPYDLHNAALWQQSEQQQELEPEQHTIFVPPPDSHAPTNQETPEFRPFKQRLEGYQRDLQEGIATGVLRRSDDTFLFFVSEMAEQVPLLLPIAEKCLARISAGIEGTPPPAPFTKKEQDRILGVRETIQEYDGEVPEILW